MSIKISIYGVECEFDNYNTYAVLTELEEKAIKYVCNEFTKRVLILNAFDSEGEARII